MVGINGRCVINLYVPDTLSNISNISCTPPAVIKGMVSPIVPDFPKKPFFGCRKSYQKYINLTGDKKWTGLLIWQHLKNTECTYTQNLKCTGCEPSGLSREIEEGKKYSSQAYKTSLRSGRAELTGSTEKGQYRFNIHNSKRKV